MRYTAGGWIASLPIGLERKSVLGVEFFPAKEVNLNVWKTDFPISFDTNDDRSVASSRSARMRYYPYEKPSRPGNIGDYRIVLLTGVRLLTTMSSVLHEPREPERVPPRHAIQSSMLLENFKYYSEDD